jgi:hypothetical protein
MALCPVAIPTCPLFHLFIPFFLVDPALGSFHALRHCTRRYDLLDVYSTFVSYVRSSALYQVSCIRYQAHAFLDLLSYLYLYYILYT